MKYTLSIGLNDKDTKTQIINKNDAIDVIAAALLKNNVYSFTLRDAIGYYKEKKENTIQAIIYSDVSIDTDLKKACSSICVGLNQECIALEYTDIKSDLIGA